MDVWFPIATPRLMLRQFAEHDEPDVHEFASDLAVTRYTDWGPNTEAETRDRIRGYLREQSSWPRAEVNLAVEQYMQHKVIGTIRLAILNEETRTADFGFAFNRLYWNQGYATEAASAILRTAFTTLALHRVWATCDTRNVGSWRVMEKLGLRREAEFRQDALQKGQWRDSYLYAILEGDKAVSRLGSGLNPDGPREPDTGSSEALM